MMHITNTIEPTMELSGLTIVGLAVLCIITIAIVIYTIRLIVKTKSKNKKD